MAINYRHPSGEPYADCGECRDLGLECIWLGAEYEACIKELKIEHRRWSMNRLSEKLKELRERKVVERSATESDVAKATGIDVRIIRNLEAGTRKDISVQEVCKLTAFYGCSPTELYDIVKEDISGQ